MRRKGRHFTRARATRRNRASVKDGAGKSHLILADINEVRVVASVSLQDIPEFSTVLAILNRVRCHKNHSFSGWSGSSKSIEGGTKGRGRETGFKIKQFGETCGTCALKVAAETSVMTPSYKSRARQGERRLRKRKKTFGHATMFACI